MKLLDKEVSLTNKPIYIAEISGNHDGTLQSIYNHLDAAKQANADAVKIQTIFPDEMCLNNGWKVPKGLWQGKELYELYKSKSITHIVSDIFEYGRSVNIPVFSSVFGFKSLELLEKNNCPAYKISNFENNWYELVKACIDTGKPVMVSGRNYHKTIPMHCVSEYPCDIKHANLRALNAYRGLHPVFGYSDHTVGTKAAEYATILGARIIEKHFTINEQGLDAAFSARQDSFKKMVENCNTAFEALGSLGYINPQEGALFKRSLYLKNSMKKGETITSDDVAVLRPNLGDPPHNLRYYIGTVLKEDIQAGTPLSGKLIGD